MILVCLFSQTTSWILKVHTQAQLLVRKMHRKSLIFSDLDSLHQKLKSVETLRKNETCDSIRNVLNDTADIENTILSELRALLQASLRNIMHLISLRKRFTK